jgi:DNA-directed RNA polymerase subunit RPC12/RpoP
VRNILTTVPSKKEKLPLSVTHPELATQAYGWDPNSVTFGSERKLNWRCPVGHLYLATPVDRTRKDRGRGCPYCSNQKFLVGFNDLATTHPLIAEMAFGWDPTSLLAGSREIKKWKCSLNHITTGSVFNRTRAKDICPVCSGTEVLRGFNDLATTHHSLAEEANGWDPGLISAGSNKKLEWKCKVGHIFNSFVYSRALNGNGCPICADQQVLSGYNDLATTHPEIALEAFRWDPSKVSFGSDKRRDWICSIGHIFKVTPNSRTSREKISGCPYCSNKLLLSGFNDLKTKYPRLAEEADGWDPTQVITGARKNFNWRCNEGHTFNASADNRIRGGTGCPSCTSYGYDPNQSGNLYFLEHSDWEMFQIGITNYPDQRLNQHKKSGWRVLELRGPMDGHLTQQWETAILRMLKAKGADLSNEKIAGKFDGYSEAWSKSTFEVLSIKEMMKMTEEFEEIK